MTDRELMQMALEELEELADVGYGSKTVLKALRDRLAQPEPEFVAYAGVTVWIGEHRITQRLTKIQIETEIVPGMSITETAQQCLDMLADAKEKNTRKNLLPRLLL